MEMDRLFGGSIPALYDQCHARSGTTASTRASGCAKPSALAYRSRIGGSSRRGNFLPSACLFLQKGGNGPADSTLGGTGKPNRSRRVFVS